MPATIDEIIDNFSFLDDWDDRYRYLIELGRTLQPMSDNEKTEANKVRGCASQVWLVAEPRQENGEAVVDFRGDSDAHIVRGLVALTLALFSGKPARTILETDHAKVFSELGLSEHLTPQRSNGVRSMVERIKAHALAALAQA